jgi:hypothetical protein
MGMPRRIYIYAADSGFAELNMAISTFAIIFGLSQLILVWNIVRSVKKGEKVGKDPWGGWSLEWAVTSPPPTPSFAENPTQYDANYPLASVNGKFENVKSILLFPSGDSHSIKKKMLVKNKVTGKYIGEIAGYNSENYTLEFVDNVSLERETELMIYDKPHQTKLESILRSPFKAMNKLWNKEVEE